MERYTATATRGAYSGHHTGTENSEEETYFSGAQTESVTWWRVVGSKLQASLFSQGLSHCVDHQRVVGSKAIQSLPLLLLSTPELSAMASMPLHLWSGE